MKNESLTGYQVALAALKVGDTVGIRSGTGASKKVYRIEKVERVTKAQIILANGDRFIKNGRALGGTTTIQIMSPHEIKRWRAAKEAEVERVAIRQANYDPREHDDAVQAALRAMRDKARILCEKLQAEVNDNLTRDPAGAMMPHWWAEYLQMLVQIEESENALKSIGLSTTLKPSSEQSSLFR